MSKESNIFRSTRYKVLAIILPMLAAVLYVSVASASFPSSTTNSPTSSNGSASVSSASAPKANQATNAQGSRMSASPRGPVFVGHELKHDTSPRLDSMPAAPVQPKEEREIGRRKPGVGGVQDKDSVIQSAFGPLAMPTPIINMDGIDFATSSCACAPPDTTGDVGPNHFVQAVNTAYNVFDKNTGLPLGAPRPLNTLWAGFGGVCQTRNDGDPIVKYDQLADRWVINQFTTAPPYTQCIAVSTTGDPNGTYHRYAFAQFEPNTRFGDYQKIGVWPDAYYMSNNEFGPPPNYDWMGAGNYAFDRARMLQGLSATYVYFGLPPTVWGGQQPSDLDGSNLPPAGAPNLFIEIDDSAWDPPNIPTDQMQMWRFHADFITPSNSSFTPLPAITPPNLAAFDGLLCNFDDCIPQTGTTSRLDSLADRLMYRVAYRNFGTHESIVFNHTVDTAVDKAAIRWYELRGINATPSIFQQGTYDPVPTEHRWMGSLAQDNQGNMALGFSVSSTTMFPSIKYTGRLVTDPPGQMPQGEATLHNGTGSQVGTQGRWGDYSTMVVDPVDDCTFWYTQEYYGVTASFSWRTRFGSFKYPGCTAPVQGTPTATVVVPTPTLTVAPTFTAVPSNTVVATTSATRTNTPGVSTPTSTSVVGTPSATATSPAVSTPPPTATSPAASSPTPTRCAVSFRDVPSGHTFYAAVQCLACRGIISGYADGTFKPDNLVTRGQLAKIVSNAGNFTEPAGAQIFQDVPSDHPFYEWINRLTRRGYMSGYTCGTIPGEPCVDNRPYFRPYANATRAQTSKIVANAAHYIDPPAGQTFEDVPPSHPFYESIQRLASRNVMGGYNCGGLGEPCVSGKPYFRPYNDVTRGQSAKIVANAFFPTCGTTSGP